MRFAGLKFCKFGLVIKIKQFVFDLGGTCMSKGIYEENEISIANFNQ